MLKERFADLKDGASIVSSKAFCLFNFRYFFNFLYVFNEFLVTLIKYKLSGAIPCLALGAPITPPPYLIFYFFFKIRGGSFFSNFIPWGGL